MIAQYDQTEIESTARSGWLRPLPIIAGILGLLFAYLFTQLWPQFGGFAALALWPLGFATGLFGVTLMASIIKRQMHWDLLIAGKMLTLAGTLLFFIASL
jgi:hypothetical protein